MRYFSLPLFLLLTFAVAVGDFAFRTWYPSTTSEYAVGGDVRPLVSASGNEAKKHLYLRRSWYLSQSPDRAWIQVLGHDEIEVFVNGRNVGRSSLVGQSRVASVLTDISPYLTVGRNVVAIHALQSVIGRPPAVAVDGQFEFPDGSQMSLGDPQDWRSTDFYDQHGAFWYETLFDDAHWLPPKVAEAVTWRTQVEFPPRAITESRRSKWITPTKSADGSAAMARDFTFPAAARDGWLRVIATGAYRVAINGSLVADDGADLAAEAPDHPVERTFDISPFLRAGANTVSVSITTRGEAPRLRADLEATAFGEQRVYIGTDEAWKSSSGLTVDWQRPSLTNADWQPCTAEIGYVGVVPRVMTRELGEIRPPVSFWLLRAFHWLWLVALTGIVAGVGCYIVGQFLRRRTAETFNVIALPFFALLLSTILATAAGLMTWDIAWTGHDFYQPKWLLGLAALVAAQWLLLAAIAVGRLDALAGRLAALIGPAGERFQRTGVVLCWVLVFGVALWLRVRDIVAEPMHHDEVTAYMYTQSVLEHGFPGGQVDPDIPFGYCATSELMYYPTALCSLFVDDPRLVLRIPATIWSMATLVLLAYIGWRWFNPYVGFLAAVLYAVSPHAIGMADFGRYLSQVQFFTLLTMVLTYEAVRGTGTPPLGLMWGSAISFIAMYLSWEGTGIFGVGLTLAVLFQRRRHLRPIFACPSFYYASAVVGLVVLGQDAHRVMQQTQRIWYGEGISSLTMKPMWKFPFFDPSFFLINSSWIRDALLPMVGLAAACLLTLRHRWRFPLRFSIICLVVNAELMAALLPLRTNRYSYHLTDILILVSAAAAVVGCETLLQLVRDFRWPAPYRWYVGATTASAVLVGTVLASGWGVRTSELDDYVTSAYDVKQLRNPDWDALTKYLLGHIRDGDALIAIFPHAENFTIEAQTGPDAKPQKVGYWLESKLIVQATIGDTHDVPLDRRSGAVMLYNKEQVERLFAEHPRVWYCTMRHGHSRINESDVSEYLRGHMEVVYEDFDTALMVHDSNDRPAPVRLKEEDTEHVASDYFLH